MFLASKLTTPKTTWEIYRFFTQASCFAQNPKRCLSNCWDKCWVNIDVCSFHPIKINCSQTQTQIETNAQLAEKRRKKGRSWILAKGGCAVFSVLFFVVFLRQRWLRWRWLRWRWSFRRPSRWSLWRQRRRTNLQLFDLLFWNKILQKLDKMIPRWLMRFFPSCKSYV